MRLVKARVQGYRSILDSGYFDIENGKTILVGPNEAGKTALLQALQQLNPPQGVEPFDPLRDYPRAKYDEDIVKKRVDPSQFTVVEGHFSLEEADKEEIPATYHDAVYIYGRHLDNKAWHRLDGGPNALSYADIEKDLLRLNTHFQTYCKEQGGTDSSITTIQTEFEKSIAGLTKITILSSEQANVISAWLDKNISNLDENNQRENDRFDKIKDMLRLPAERDEVLKKCSSLLPTFILFSNYFRVRPVLHLQKLAQRIAGNVMDDKQYDYGNTCLLKFLGFTAQELSDAGNTAKFDLSKPEQYEKYRAQLDARDYQLNAATIHLTDAIREVWNPTQDSRDANKLRIKVDGQYLKVVVEDELGVEVELDQRSEGFQWLVSFYVVFFAEASEKHKNAILLLDEPGQSLHALKQAEFRETLSKLSEKNQTIFTTHSPFLVGANELEKVRVVEMVDRKSGTKVNLSLTATDSGAMLPLQEALGYDLAQSLFFHKKNLVLEGITDMWYLEGLSELLIADGKTGLDAKIALLPANCATKVVYYATILHAQNLKVAALLDSDAEGDLAATQDTLVNALGNKRILRTKDAYEGEVARVEIEDMLRETLVTIAKEQLGWDVSEIAQKQPKRPIVDVFTAAIKSDFSKFKLAKAFIRWTKEHTLADLTSNEVRLAETLIAKINKALT